MQKIKLQETLGKTTVPSDPMNMNSYKILISMIKKTSLIRFTTQYVPIKIQNRQHPDQKDTWVRQSESEEYIKNPLVPPNRERMNPEIPPI